MRTARLLLLLPLFACLLPRPHDHEHDHDTGVDCDDMAVASVVVEIVDPDGQPLPVGDVTYRVDGAASEQAVCSDASGPPCAAWTAGWEVAGEIVVTAVYDEPPTDTGACCWPHDEASATVTVGKTADGCHVETEHVTITLDPSQQMCLDTACP